MCNMNLSRFVGLQTLSGLRVLGQVGVEGRALGLAVADPETKRTPSCYNNK